MKKHEQQYKAVFRARIDFYEKYKSSKALSPGTHYYFQNEEKFSYSDIVEESERIIDVALKPELQRCTNLTIQEVQTQFIYEGSIEIIFTVILSFFNLIGGLKDLYDTVHLIESIAEKQINKRLNDKFGNYFSVDTYAIAPRTYERYYLEKGHTIEQNRNEAPPRDAFFYYLLVANIVLLLIMIALVLVAVKRVYFL